MFFKSMPNIIYKYQDKTIITKDIFKRVGFSSSIASKVNLVSYYIGDGETPDMLADRFYGSSQYHWLILTCNDIVNVYEEWPVPSSKIFELVESKYGAGNATDAHHYCLTSDTNIVVDYAPGGNIQEVSNIAYEQEVNDSKRQIFILKTEYLKDFVNAYKKLMAQ